MRRTSAFVPTWICLFAFLFCFSCGFSGGDDDDGAFPDDDDSDDDSAAADDDVEDDTEPADDSTTDDTADDSVADDSTDDTDDIPPPPNPNAKADAFRLFYKERALRTILAYNRFAMAGDAVAATTFNKMAVARTGDEWEVVPGPNDNNTIGFSVFTAWKLYQAIGGRDLELSLIRMFEGLAFNEAVSGHPGLTCREALPGWTHVMDGIGGHIERTRFGTPVTPPVTYPPELEQEILDTFYDGVVFTYRENPEEYYFNFKAVNELQEFAITFVFDELPTFLRISNCCSSWMISQKGIWEGAFWGNHNSRDNFTDYAMGYLAALEAEATPDLPDDLADAAHNAAEAARNTGDRIIADGNIQMTVDEFHDYETLTPGGQTRPDGTTEWQDLGSLSSCQMAYLASAVSSGGLSSPVPEIPLPGAIETSLVKMIFDTLHIPLPPPEMTCRSVDDAFVGLGWGDLLKLEVFGIPWYEFAKFLTYFFPDLFFDLLGGMMDDFKELELGAVGLCYYAQIADDQNLYHESRQTLKNLIDLQRIFADLVYGVVRDPDLREAAARTRGPNAVARAAADAQEMLYFAAAYARMFDLYSPLDDFQGFGAEISQGNSIMSQLDKPDTAEWALLSDGDIAERIDASLAGKEDWIQTRYETRFGDTDPVRRAGDGYECIGPDDNWMPTENPRHDWFGGARLWFVAPLCVFAPQTLDCEWAKLGCTPADLDESLAVDAADQALFDAAWAAYGSGAACSAGNDWCDGADLDKSGILDAEDQSYMSAAQGCVVYQV